MSRLVAIFVRGLGVILPLVLTAWLVAWTVRGVETALREVFLWFFPAESYLPGLGLAMAVGVIFAAGLLVQVFIIRQLWAGLEGMLDRIPLVKTIYHAVRDFLAFFSSNMSSDMSKVVLVDLSPGVQAIGFVTDQTLEFLQHETKADERRVAVYLPMSYMVGGYTLLVESTRLVPCDMSVEQAMRYALTAGIQAHSQT